MAGELLQTIRFRNAEAFTGLTGIVDFDKCVVHGVSLITGQMEAEGHDLMVDDTTTNQLFKLAKTAGQVPVYLDHGSGIKELNGYLDNVRMDGTKVRGDWNLLKTHDETPVMLERADRQPKTFGLSVSFKGQGVAVAGGKKAARATKLLSADVVPRPAANKEGLFGVKENPQVDTTQKSMNQPGAQAGEQTATLDDVLEALGTIGTRLDNIETTQQGFRDELDQSAGGSELGEDDYNTLVGLTKMTDAQLIAAGTNRAEVNQAVTEWNASVDAAEAAASGDGDADGETGESGDGVSAGTEAAAVGAVGGGAETTAAMKALERQVIALSSKWAAREKRETEAAEEIQFEEAKAGVTELLEKLQELTEFSTKVVAENQALRIYQRTGTRPVNPSMADGERLFSANDDGQLHQFQKRVKELVTEKKCSHGRAIQLASAENPALHLDWLQSGGGSQPVLTA